MLFVTRVALHWHKLLEDLSSYRTWFFASCNTLSIFSKVGLTFRPKLPPRLAQLDTQKRWHLGSVWQPDSSGSCFSNSRRSHFLVFDSGLKSHPFILSYSLHFQQISENPEFDDPMGEGIFEDPRWFKFLDSHHHEIHPIVKLSLKE